MKTSLRLAFRKGDLLAIFLVAVLAAGTAVSFAMWNDPAQNQLVQIYLDGELIRELPLETDDTLQITGEYSNTVFIRDGKAAIVDSDCPGGDCVHSGWIDSAGRSIVCLPNRAELRIVGTTDADVDFAVG